MPHMHTRSAENRLQASFYVPLIDSFRQQRVDSSPQDIATCVVIETPGEFGCTALRLYGDGRCASESIPSSYTANLKGGHNN